jgi:Zn-dependent peptidase ImmA (M78 family)
MIVVTYPCSRSAMCTVRDASGIWAVAAAVRRQLQLADDQLAISWDRLSTASRSLCVNGRDFKVEWDFEHAVHDESGAEVQGVCENDGETSDYAYVSINGPLLKDAERRLSASGHELGHAILDMPAALAGHRPYRCFTTNAEAAAKSQNRSEWRANEFMGALLAPPFRLHKELLRRARSEEMNLVRVRHAGRPTWPALSGDNDPEALAGIVEVLATDFGLSRQFIEVRLSRYGLINRTTGDQS